MIVWFDNAAALEIQRTGGKGANLAAARRAGLPVPDAFVVEAAAYRALTGHQDGKLAELAGNGDAAAARDLVCRLPLSPAMEQAIVDAYAKLGRGRVAVRSSATLEDLDEASFAGQQDTYLDIVGDDEVVRAVRDCWASLWTDRAVRYRAEHGFAGTEPSIAVVVQTMVEPTVSGVMFTVDPMAPGNGAMVVNASYGLGESVVSSAVVPDEFRLATDPFRVLSRTVGSKETRLDRAPGSGVVQSGVGADDRARESLTEAQLAELVELGRRVEAHFGSAQDVEWAYSTDALHLLQSRPVTSPSTAASSGHVDDGSKVAKIARDDLIEHYPAPYPVDLVAVLAVQEQLQGLMNGIGLDSGTAADVIRMDDNGVFSIDARRPRLRLRALRDAPRMLRAGMRHDPAGWAAEEAAARSRLGALRERMAVPETLRDAELVAVVDDGIAEVSHITDARFVRYIAPMIVNRAIASTLIRASRQANLTVEDLYVGVDYKTSEIDRAMSALAARAGELGLKEAFTSGELATGEELAAQLPPDHPFRRELDGFLAEFGGRTSRMYLPFSNSSWREDPAPLFAMMAGKLRAPERRSAPRDVAVEVANGLPGPLRSRWAGVVDKLRRQYVAREASVYLIEEFFGVARGAVRELARRLVERHALGSAADIVWLTWDEIKAAVAADGPGELGGLIARRRRMRPQAEALWWDRGAVADGDSVVSGLAGSPGRAAGPVRIVSGPGEFAKLRTGDVLVCRFTDPTWTPLFSSAAAIVCDSGGPLSHAAIVAREYGIPAVLGTGVASQTLHDDDRVLVDGSAGTVTYAEDRDG
jgi:pyruvate,water dikinase